MLLLTRGGNQTAVSPNDRAIKLSNYVANPDAKLVYIKDGPINASQNHRAIRITVTPNFKIIDVIQGYQGAVIKTETFANSNDAFGQFLAALDRVGYTKENRGKSYKDSISACPTALRYYYRIYASDEEIMNLWSASCTTGSFAGDVRSTQSLFQAQIPDYFKFTNGVNFALSQ